MKGIILNMQEQTKYEIVKSFVDSKLTNYKKLSVKLHVCLRTAYNYVKKYNEVGKEGFSHKNHNHKPVHTLSPKIKLRIIDLYKTLGTDINFSHFRDILERDYNIKVSRTTIHRIITEAGFYSPKAQKATIKKRNKAIRQKLENKNTLTPIEQNIVADHLLDSDIAHPRKERSKYFGELIQLDASQHVWFGKTKYHLHAAIDDCTGQILALFFDKQETLYGYYNVMKQIIEKHGIPAQLLTDNRTVFNYIRKGKTSEEHDTFTQFGFMCHRLGIALYTSSVPQVKGRIERLFQTLQSRLIVEMRHKKIEDVEMANKFAQSYITEYNSLFALPYNHTINAFEKQTECFDINEFLAIVSRRICDNGGCIKYENSYYKFYRETGEQIVPEPKTNCLVVKKFDGQLIAIINEFSYILEKFNSHREDSILEPIIKKERKHYQPSLKHPWKQKSYLNYLKNYRSKLQNNYKYIDE